MNMCNVHVTIHHHGSKYRLINCGHYIFFSIITICKVYHTIKNSSLGVFEKRFKSLTRPFKNGEKYYLLRIRHIENN